MPPRRGPSDLIRTLAASLTPTRLPADVIGYINGLLQVQVEGRIVIIEYAGIDELLNGYKIWVTRNNDDPHGSYSYAGLRLESGTIHFSTPQTRGHVAKAAADHLVNSRIINGNAGILLPDRRYVQFSGDVVVTDDPLGNKVVVEVVGGSGSGASIDDDYDSASVDYDDTSTLYDEILTGSDSIDFVLYIASGGVGYLRVGQDCTIKKVTLIADVVGSVVVDIRKTNFAGFPPTSGNSIVASAPPTLSAAQIGQDLTLTGWTTALSRDDILEFLVTSHTTIQQVTCSLGVQRTGL